MRKLAPLVDRSKSSVHRHIQAKEKRNKHPESELWETEAGSIWLRLLVFAAIYLFGIKSGVGEGFSHKNPNRCKKFSNWSGQSVKRSNVAWKFLKLAFRNKRILNVRKEAIT